MNPNGEKSLIFTVKERCRVCYTCVRECPAKAIRIVDGQADVIPERCIGCGNCVRVCSQGAKQVLSGIERTAELLAGNTKVAALIAPSFPATLREGMDHEQFVAMIRELGFDYVSEVAFGADLVANEYRKLLASESQLRHIATTCPAIVAYVERYHPELVGMLAPVVSPMLAMARVVRYLHGPQTNVVFIGPCIAKKGEMSGPYGEIDVALTFIEMWQMFSRTRINPDPNELSNFDPPHGGAGALFPIARGMLQAADIHDDLVVGDVVAAEGRASFIPAIKEFGNGDLDARLLEVLCCDGCIMGAGMGSYATMFSRRARVSEYVRERIKSLDMTEWQRCIKRVAQIDLSRVFVPYDQRIAVPSQDEIDRVMAKMGKFSPADELNCGACGYDSCREHAIAILKGLAENEMCLPNTISKLRNTVEELADSHTELANTQEALMHSERLASMGQLAAGIAHEVNNPLGVVLMYSHLLLDEIGHDAGMSEDLKMIAEQADRCKKIVAGLLDFARQNKVVPIDTNVGELIDRCLEAVHAPDGVNLVAKHELSDPIAQLDADQIQQLLTNLLTNAIAAMPDGGDIMARSSGDTETLTISVEDTGSGIAEDHLGKVFEPFFTTKQMGKGTGLGLAVSYGIVKMHRGDIKVTSNNDKDNGPTGTTFTVTLPRKAEI